MPMTDVYRYDRRYPREQLYQDGLLFATDLTSGFEDEDLDA